MPRDDRALDEVGGQVEGDAQRRGDHHRCQNEVRAEGVLLHAHVDAQALLRTDVLGEDRARHRVRDADAQRREERRHRLRQAHHPELLPAAGAHAAEQTRGVTVRAVKGLDEANRYREERHQGHHQHLRHDAKAEPDDDQGRNGNHRHGLRGHEQRLQPLPQSR